MVLPGDYVGVSEEYLPGFGVYSEEDKLYSSNVGELDLDAKTHVAKVMVKTRIPKMQSPGIIVIGIVAGVMENVALIDLLPFKSKNFVFVPQGATAILHVSKVKRGYIEHLSSEIKTGDIVRVKIIEVSKHTVNLTTDEKNLGVIKAYCSICRHELKRSGRMLVCDNCKNKENRKMAYDYGMGKVL